MSFLSTLSAIIGSPINLAQAGVVAGAALLLFLLLYTLRDILLRTKSFPYQFFCVLLVGALPILGFLVYLLVRPARTLKQRETDAMLRRILGEEDVVNGTEVLEIEEVIEEDVPEMDKEEAEDDASSSESVTPTV